MAGPVIDRQALAGELVTARSMTVATMPADDDEPDAGSRLWMLGVGRVLVQASRAGDLATKRDLVVHAGGAILGWLEAIDAARERA